MLPHIQSLSDDFALFDNWEDRYSYLIDLGKNIPSMPDELKTDASIVTGCTSRVWMITTVNEDGCLLLQADSDAHIVRGLIGVLMKIYNHQPVRLIKDIDIKQAFSEIGLESHLSPNRRNGFFSMVERLQLIAK